MSDKSFKGDRMEKRKQTSLYAEKISVYGVRILLCVFPLFITNGYYNITASKAVFFCVVSFAVFALCLFADVFSRGKCRKKSEMCVGREKSNDIAVILFAIFSLLSFAFSEYKASSLTGRDGRYMGLVFVISACAMYVFVSKYYVFSEKELIAFEAVSLVVGVIAVIQFCGVDIFGLHRGLSEKDRLIYLSTVGNQNVFSGYVCLFVPLAVYLFCKSRNPRTQALYACAATVGYFALFISRSDSGYLGFICGFFVAFLLVFEDLKSLKRFVLCIIIFFVCALVFDFLTCGTTRLNSFVGSFRLSFAAICSLVVLLVIFSKADISQKTLRRLGRFVIIIFAVCVLGAVTAFVYFSFIDRKTDIGSLEDYLRFSDKWGTERGYIWKGMLDIFKSFSFKDKLFGSGEDTVRLLMQNRFPSEMNAQSNYTDNAHNALLQILLTQGIFGLVSYICVIVLSVRAYLSKKKATDAYKGIIIPVAAFLAQDAVNITQPITTPVMLVFLAMLSCKTDSKQ